MTLLSKQISYPAGDTTVPGILYLPGDQADCAAVIVFHGSDGFKSNHEMIARRLAKEGFAALALTWFGGGSSRSLWSAVRAEDILQATAFLEQQPGVDADRLGLIGFSRGGGLALIMAALIPQTKAVVNYFGILSRNFAARFYLFTGKRIQWFPLVTPSRWMPRVKNMESITAIFFIRVSIIRSSGPAINMTARPTWIHGIKRFDF